MVPTLPAAVSRPQPWRIANFQPGGQIVARKRVPLNGSERVQVVSEAEIRQNAGLPTSFNPIDAIPNARKVITPAAADGKK